MNLAPLGKSGARVAHRPLWKGFQEEGPFHFRMEGKKEEKSSFPAEGEARAKAWRPVSMGAVQEWEEGGGGRRNRASPGEMLNILSSGGMWILENVHSCSVGKRCEGAQEGGDLRLARRPLSGQTRDGGALTRAGGTSRRWTHRPRWSVGVRQREGSRSGWVGEV